MDIVTLKDDVRKLDDGNERVTVYNKQNDVPSKLDFISGGCFY